MVAVAAELVPGKCPGTVVLDDGARRANAAELAASQILTPSQAAAMRREALDAARREIEQMNVDAAVAPSMPTQVARREIRADTVTARDAAVVAPPPGHVRS